MYRQNVPRCRGIVVVGREEDTLWSPCGTQIRFPLAFIIVHERSPVAWEGVSPSIRLRDVDALCGNTTQRNLSEYVYSKQDSMQNRSCYIQWFMVRVCHKNIKRITITKKKRLNYIIVGNACIDNICGSSG